MKRPIATRCITAVATAILLVGSARRANATEVGSARKFGLGLVLGDPTGLSAKYWVTPTNALDFGLGFWGYGVGNHCWHDNAGYAHCDNYYGYHHAGTVNVDYLWEWNIARGKAQLDWHLGPGGRLIWRGQCNGDCVALAARMPVGLDLTFSEPSFLELFLELAPAFYVVPGFDFAIEAGLGIRFYF
jgi:hypothetical protein